MAAANGWRDEIRDQVRGFAGGMLFGIPLLFTMEMWWIAAHSTPPQLAMVLAMTFVVVLALSQLSGFHADPPRTFRRVLADAVEAVAMGIVVSLTVLVMVREITLATPPGEALGKLVYHSITASIGVALASQFFRGAADEPDSAGEEAGGGDLLGTVVDLGATAIGAMFVASAIAPTDEIAMLAAATSPPWLLGVIATSLLVSYCVVFVSGFGDEEQRRHQRGVLQHPITETMVAYLVALMTCAGMLVVLQRVDLTDPWTGWLPSVLLLGFPAAVGGAAGRLAV